MTEPLTDEEKGIVMGLVRDAVRKNDKSREALRERHGDEFDGSAKDRRQAFLFSIYRKMGGTPENITNRRGIDV